MKSVNGQELKNVEHSYFNQDPAGLAGNIYDFHRGSFTSYYVHDDVYVIRENGYRIITIIHPTA